VTLSSTGRVTLPADVRRRLHLEGDVELDVEVDEEHDAIVLRPALVLRREDAWAYEPSHRTLLERAHKDSAEGRVLEFATEDELGRAIDEMTERIAGESDDQLPEAISELAATIRSARPDLTPPL